MSGRVDGDVAIVTGAAQGIGKAIARRLGEEGASVMIPDLQAEKAAETAEELAAETGAEYDSLECDVTSLDDTDRLREATEERFGNVDILINNAGVGSEGYFPEDIDPEEWHRVIDINLNGTYNVLYSVVPSMIEQEYGRIVNLSSMAGRSISYHSGANYTTSKWAVIGLSKHLAWDLADDNITVNALCPGSTLTPLVKAQTSEEGRQVTADKIPLNRWAQPEDQANAALYLVGDEGTFVTGTVLEVDGGKQLLPRHDS